MAHWLRNALLILAACYFDCKGEEGVEQQSGHVTALEGGLVTLSCNYTTSMEPWLRNAAFCYEKKTQSFSHQEM
ncbi:unnamed protein product [Oncorhynchus mykiss]|uniref:Immunoglobulin V-set domain-containing protein n=1 Tax=Oncorhynchus mykiss TaxID=8022 RepID=A0A060X3W1_ONCMY|nr:unnamed protein product [Oncorhynchus mykiss]